MAAVDAGDALRYGARYVGLVALLGAVTGALLGGGWYLASTAGLALTDPSTATLTTARGAGAAALLVLGTVVGVVSAVALAYKFLADLVAAGVRYATDLGVAMPPSEDRETTAPADAAAHAEETADAAAAAGTAATASTDTAASTASDGAEAGRGGAADGQASAGNDEPPTATGTAAPPAEGSPADSGASGSGDAGDVADQQTEGQRAAGDDGSVVDKYDTNAAEWTPPDPEEIERKQREGGQAEQSRTDGGDAGGTGAGADGRGASDAPSDDASLADEGVGSVEVATDEDPLSDRL